MVSRRSPSCCKVFVSTVTMRLNSSRFGTSTMDKGTTVDSIRLEILLTPPGEAKDDRILRFIIRARTEKAYAEHMASGSEFWCPRIRIVSA